MKVPFALGRLLFGGYFLYNGINHFRNHKMLSGYAQSKEVPQPDAAVALSGAALIVGGASILLGVKPKLGTLAVMGFLAAVSPMMHDFWNVEDEQQRMGEMVNFTKNVALLGSGLMFLAIPAPWPFSLSRRRIETATHVHPAHA